MGYGAILVDKICSLAFLGSECEEGDLAGLLAPTLEPESDYQAAGQQP